jgi:cyanophycin synthetase
MTNTSGVYVGGKRMRSGDSSGPRSARIVLADPTVGVTVLETARGGLLREGLAYDRADVGVVLNVSADHLGLKGIDTLGDLARVKSVVARRVRRRGTTVLNADDPLTRRMSRRAGGRVAFFTASAFDGVDDELRRHVEEGGALATLEAGRIVLRDGPSILDIVDGSGIPATWGGAAMFNVSNAQAAALAAHALGVAPETIATALATFDGSFEQNPGRLNITEVPGFTTIVDYAHNPAALQALGVLIERMRPDYDRVIGVISTPGDRRDDDILELGRLSAEIFDEVVFRELPDGRGRARGGVVGLLSESAERAGLGSEHIRRVMDENEAMDAALRLAGPRDLVVLTVSSVEAVWAQVNAFTPEWAAAGV